MYRQITHGWGIEECDLFSANYILKYTTKDPRARDQNGEASREREAKCPLGLKPADQKLDLPAVTTSDTKYPRAHAEPENERAYILRMGSNPPCHHAYSRDE